MSRKRYPVEQIIGELREAEVELSKGSKAPQVGRKLGISEQTSLARVGVTNGQEPEL